MEQRCFGDMKAQKFDILGGISSPDAKEESNALLMMRFSKGKLQTMIGQNLL